MEKQLQTIVNKIDVTHDAATQLIKAFGAPFSEVGEILADYQYDDMGELIATDKTIVVTSEDDAAAMKKARTIRLELKKVRTTVENKRKELKEDSLRTGKAIDSVAKYIKDNIEPVEKYLETQEKFAEIKAAERATKLKMERLAKLQPICDNPLVYSIDNMKDEDFDKLYTELLAAHELKVAQAEAYEREQERIRAEKEADDLRVREENEILRQQAAAREAEIAQEREEQAIVHEAELAAVVEEVKSKSLETIKNEINSLERFTVMGANYGRPMIDYKAVIDLLAEVK